MEYLIATAFCLGLLWLGSKWTKAVRKDTIDEIGPAKIDEGFALGLAEGRKETLELQAVVSQRLELAYQNGWAAARGERPALPPPGANTLMLAPGYTATVRRNAEPKGEAK